MMSIRPRTMLIYAVLTGVVAITPWIAYATEDPFQTAEVQDPASLEVGRLIPDLSLVALDGSTRQLSELLKKNKAVALVMTSTGCPLSKRYAPRIAAVEKLFAPRAVPFVYVNTVASETTEDMRRQIRDYGLKGLYCPDRDQSIARALGARTTTEIFVLDAARTLVYRGAVDDHFGVGTARSTARRAFLTDALQAVLQGRAPKIAATWPPGCLLDLPVSTSAPTEAVTYYGRIARTMVNHCVECHRPGGIAPFPLDSLAALRGRLSMIEAVIEQGLMPPGHGITHTAASPTVVATPRMLPDRDRRDLLAWLRSNRPVGNRADAPLIPALSQNWTIGAPDLLLSSTAIDLPLEGPLHYARRIIATDLVSDRWVQSLELRPMKNDTIHHAMVWILPPGGTLPATGKVPSNLQLLATYSPGDSVLEYDQNVARRIPAGSLLVADLYTLPMGRAMSLRFRLGLRFAPAPPPLAVATVTIAADTLNLPPQADATVCTAQTTLKQDRRVSALTPYMRARGKKIAVTATLPDGSSRTLLDAPRYDYRWQIRYPMPEPLRLPAGTRIVVQGTFDNSDGNPNNPDPVASVAAGAAADQDALMVILETLIEPDDA